MLAISLILAKPKRDARAVPQAIGQTNQQHHRRLNQPGCCEVAYINNVAWQRRKKPGDYHLGVRVISCDEKTCGLSVHRRIVRMKEFRHRGNAFHDFSAGRHARHGFTA